MLDSLSNILWTNSVRSKSNAIQYSDAFNLQFDGLWLPELWNFSYGKLNYNVADLWGTRGSSQKRWMTQLDDAFFWIMKRLLTAMSQPLGNRGTINDRLTATCIVELQPTVHQFYDLLFSVIFYLTIIKFAVLWQHKHFVIQVQVHHYVYVWRRYSRKMHAEMFFSGYLWNQLMWYVWQHFYSTVEATL